MRFGVIAVPLALTSLFACSSDGGGGGGPAYQAGGTTATGGQGGNATGAVGGTGATGSGGTSSGNGGTSTAGNGGTATAGNGGTATAGNGGTAGTGMGTFVNVTSPTEGQTFQLGTLPKTATIPFAVQASPDVVAVEYVIETDFSLGTSTTPPNFALDYDYQYVGMRWTEARAKDAGGNVIATDIVNFVIEGSTNSGPCLTELDALGVSYTDTNARGVTDGVKLTGPLNGVRFTQTDTDNDATSPIACEFVKQLYLFAGLAKARGFVKIGTLGSHCYRCCCSWSQTNYCRGPNDPEPSCSSYSNHSWGRALDIRYLYKADGTRYDLNNNAHWKKGSSSTTCTSGLAAQTGISRELYELICEAGAQQIFSLALTANHNAAHRNHWHVDIGNTGRAPYSDIDESRDQR